MYSSSSSSSRPTTGAVIDEKEAFYAVRKGDVIGIYKTFADCQAQASSSPLDPSVSVYKGYSLSKEAESYLKSRGLKQAGISVSASDLQDGLFGPLSVCSFQETNGLISNSQNPPKPLNLEDYVEPKVYIGHSHVGLSATPEIVQCQVGHGNSLSSYSPLQEQVYVDSSSSHANLRKKPIELKNYPESQQQSRPSCQSCTIEFDGASKRNPGPAGAGAILRADDGSEVCRLREGVGVATNNVAEYRALILGLRVALQKGYKHVRAQGDSQLVCYQIVGRWNTKNANMASLCKVAKELINKLSSFSIDHVLREFNSNADAQANRAINLKDGEVEVEVEVDKSRA